MRLRGMKIRRFRVWVERRRRWKKSFEVWPSGDLLEIAGIFLDFSRVSPWKFSAYSLSLFTFVYGSSKISNFCSHLKCKSPQIVCQQEPESIFHQFSRGTSLKFPLESSADVSEKMSRPIMFHSSVSLSLSRVDRPIVWSLYDSFEPFQLFWFSSPSPTQSDFRHKTTRNSSPASWKHFSSHLEHKLSRVDLKANNEIKILGFFAVKRFSRDIKSGHSRIRFIAMEYGTECRKASYRKHTFFRLLLSTRALA
jgi:hypothetical protein